MASASKNGPLSPIDELDGSGEDILPTKEHPAASPEGKEKECARPTITAIRIATDGTLPYLITLQLVKATSEYHSSLHDSNRLHHSNADDLQSVHSRSSLFLDQLAGDDQLDINQMNDPLASTVEKADWPQDFFEPEPLPSANLYGKDNNTLLDMPLAKQTEKPHLTFTHASLSLQPNVLVPYWRSAEAWNRRAFQRVHADPREGFGLEELKGEYHILYTRTMGRGLRPNHWAKCRIFGDAFILKMASGKDEEGDWHYEDIPPQIMECSLINQCLETLRSLRPTDYQTMVGERGNGPAGMLSPGTGLPGMDARISDCFID